MNNAFVIWSGVFKKLVAKNKSALASSCAYKSYMINAIKHTLPSISIEEQGKNYITSLT